MRRAVIQDSVKTVLHDLEQSGVKDFFQETMEVFQRENPSAGRLDAFNLTVLSDYLIRSSNYTDNEKYILEVLGLSELLIPAFWQQFLDKDSLELPLIYGFNNKIRNAVSFLPKIIKLLEREHDPVELNSLTRSDDDGVSVQTVVLTDEGDALSTPERLVELLSSLSLIYKVIAEVSGVSENSLAVVSMDSGSEKSFDFLGIAKLMHELRETLQWAYNTISFHRQNVTVKNLQVTGDTLSLVAKINRMETDGDLTNEQALRLKHGLFTGLEKFANTGAYIPEMSDTRPQPALVMRPQQKLLTANAASLVRDAKDASFDEAHHIGNVNENQNQQESEIEFTPDQIAQAVALLKQSKGEAGVGAENIQKDKTGSKSAGRTPRRSTRSTKS